jgi:hypothetical protein
VTNQHTQCNRSEERRCLLHRDGTLTSRKIWVSSLYSVSGSCDIFIPVNSYRFRFKYVTDYYYYYWAKFSLRSKD